MTATTIEAAGGPQQAPDLAVRVMPLEGVRQSLDRKSVV